MLGAHSDLAGPPPPHFLRHLTNLLPYYGPLAEPRNFRKLVEDAVAMTDVTNSHLDWGGGVEVEEVLERATGPTPVGAIAALYGAYAKREGAYGWVCKENNLFEHAFAIRDGLREAKFIYLCRDGRDVACSMKKVPTHDQHVFYIGGEWAVEQRRCLEVHQQLAPAGVCLLVRYEDLIEAPEEQLQRVCEFVGVEYQARMLHFHRLDDSLEAARKTAYWENLDKPVMSGNKGKFYEQLSQRELEIFEARAGTYLKLLGYPLECGPPVGDGDGIPLWRKLAYWAENWVRDRLETEDLYEEEGREERRQMLRSIYERRDAVEAWEEFAPPITYSRHR